MPMNENPYVPPKQQATEGRSQLAPISFMMSGVVMTLLLASTTAGLIALFVPAFNSRAMPRFGWGGLINSLFPIIPLTQWFLKPREMTLLPSGLLLTSLGMINGIVLLNSGTVEVVENAFHDRLHSSWYWLVVPYFAMGTILAYFGFLQQRQKRTEEASAS